MVSSVIGGTFDFYNRRDASPTPTPQQTNSGKRNERPAPKSVVVEENSDKKKGLQFRYVFSQPDFVYTRVVIEHDSTGLGRLSFDKKGSEDTIVEEIVISEPVLRRLRMAFDALRFLESEESYQHRRDYSHLGTVEISLDDGAKTRTVSFNWTENIHAKGIMDDYRRLSQQFIWVFDIKLSRDNQPLDSPDLMKALENLIRRNEIADPAQLLPFLEELLRDERLPLIARNRASAIVKTIGW